MVNFQFCHFDVLTNEIIFMSSHAEKLLFNLNHYLLVTHGKVVCYSIITDYVYTFSKLRLNVANIQLFTHDYRDKTLFL